MENNLDVCKGTCSHHIYNNFVPPPWGKLEQFWNQIQSLRLAQTHILDPVKERRQ